MSRFLMLRILTIFFLAAFISNKSIAQTDLMFSKQFGTDKEEYAFNHLCDNKGNIYVAGKTSGVIDNNNFGYNDGFIIKLDSTGNTVWSRQFGTSEDEDIQWSAIDREGNVYITGSTKGDLSGANSGMDDIFVVKYFPDGKMEWTRQFGTDSIDIGYAIYVDNSGYIFITGITCGKLGETLFGKTDGFIIKLNPDGTIVFINQFGTTENDYCTGIDGNNASEIFVCGSTWGDMGEKNKGFFDAFVGKFNDKGEMLKYTQFGTDGFDMALRLIVDDENNIYVGGSTSGSLGCIQIGDGDCFLIKLDNNGDITWNKQFGTDHMDGLHGIDFNKNVSDNIIVSGIQNFPSARAFICMYKKDGSLLWDKSIGENGSASGKDVHFDNKGNIYHMGVTGTNQFGSALGGQDLYLVKFTPVKN